MQIFLLILLWSCFVIFTSFRIYHLIFAVDPETGFFLDNHISIYILGALIVLLLCFYAVLYYKNKKIKVTSYTVLDKNFPLMIISGILAIMFLTSGITEFLKVIIFKNVNFAVVINIISSLLTSVFFIMLLFRIYDKKPANNIFSFMSLAFVLWSISKILTPFIIDTSVNTISEYTFTILYYCALCAFSMAFAKFIAGRKNIYGVLITSSIAVIFSGILNVAPVFAVLFGSLHINVSVEIDTFISFGILIFLAIVNSYCIKHINDKFVPKRIETEENEN